MAARMMSRQVAEKLSRHDPVFEIQVLVSARAATKGRDNELLEATVSGFEAWTGAMNRFRRAGLEGWADRGGHAPEGLEGGAL